MNRVIFLLIIFASFFCNLSFAANTDVVTCKRKREEVDAPSSKRPRSEVPVATQIAKPRYKVILVPKEACSEEDSESDNEASHHDDKEDYYAVVVPKESYLREMTNQFFSSKFIYASQTVLRPFRITDSLEEQVNKLPQFDVNGHKMPRMKNGHVKRSECQYQKEWDRIDRGYLLVDSEDNLLGAIHFGIRMDRSLAIIETVGIDPNKQKNGYGSTLLQTAIFIASIYGAHTVELHSTKEGVMTYVKHGFWFEDTSDAKSEDDTALVPWQDYAELATKDLLDLAQLSDYGMLLDAWNDTQMLVLNQYVEKHAQPEKHFSDIIRANITAIVQHEQKLSQINELMQSTNVAQQKSAKKEFNTFLSDVEVSSEVRARLNFTNL